MAEIIDSTQLVEATYPKVSEKIAKVERSYWFATPDLTAAHMLHNKVISHPIDGIIAIPSSARQLTHIYHDNDPTMKPLRDAKFNNLTPLFLAAGMVQNADTLEITDAELTKVIQSARRAENFSEPLANDELLKILSRRSRKKNVRLITLTDDLIELATIAPENDLNIGTHLYRLGRTLPDQNIHTVAISRPKSEVKKVVEALPAGQYRQFNGFDNDMAYLGDNNILGLAK